MFRRFTLRARIHVLVGFLKISEKPGLGVIRGDRPMASALYQLATVSTNCVLDPEN